MKTQIPILALLGGVLLTGCSTPLRIPGMRPRDMIDELVRTVEPPARFKDHAPDFRIVPVTFRYWSSKNDLELARVKRSDWEKLPGCCYFLDIRHMLMDGDRYVGIVSARGIKLFITNPDEDVNSLVKPGRWIGGMGHWHQQFGVDFPWGPDPRPVQDQARPKAVTIVGSDTIRMYRCLPKDIKNKGNTVTLRWNVERTEDFAAARADHRVEISVDPVLGYVVEHSVEYEINKPTPDKHGRPVYRVDYGSLFPWGHTSPWPRFWNSTFDWSFYTPAVKDGAAGKPFAVYRNNGASINAVRARRPQRHLWVTGNGLQGYLGNNSGWGLALTRTDSEEPVHAAVCPAYGEYYVSGPLPRRPEKDGYHRVRVTRRVTGLPPEICRHIRGNANRVFHENDRALQVRLDGEGFEDQPLSLMTPHRGIRYYWQSVPGRVSTDFAHSGKKSLAVKGFPRELMKDGRFPNIPAAEAPPTSIHHARYKLECWVKVVGRDTEAFIATYGPGFTVNEEVGNPWFVRRPNEEPKTVNPMGKWRTPPVGPGDWSKITMVFKGPRWGRRLVLGFAAVGPGTAYFDDFSIKYLGPIPPGSAALELFQQAEQVLPPADENVGQEQQQKGNEQAVAHLNIVRVRGCRALE